jgi:hypothetical protein
MEEAFAPQAHHIASHRQSSRNLIITPALGSQQDHLGTQYLEVWQRILTRSAFQNLPFLP